MQEQFGDFGAAYLWIPHDQLTLRCGDEPRPVWRPRDRRDRLGVAFEGDDFLASSRRSSLPKKISSVSVTVQDSCLRLTSTFHIIILESLPPLAKYLPSGLHSIAHTSSVCSANTCVVTVGKTSLWH